MSRHKNLKHIIDDEMEVYDDYYDDYYAEDANPNIHSSGFTADEYAEQTLHQEVLPSQNAQKKKNKKKKKGGQANNEEAKVVPQHLENNPQQMIGTQPATGKSKKKKNKKNKNKHEDVDEEKKVISEDTQADAKSNYWSTMTHEKLNEIYPEYEDTKISEEWKENRDDGNLNLCIIGHVDSGKSTLMGHLLLKKGMISDKMIHKHKTQSEKMGKGSFFLAWVFDEDDEERERGVTINVGRNHFKTDKRGYTILDAPGHKDFISNMITGAAQADVGILVIDSVKGAFETGFCGGGQTAEHAILAKSLGINRVIIAVNKLESWDWDKDRFIDIKNQMNAFLNKIGYKDRALHFVPISGLEGINLTEKPDKDHPMTEWYDGPSLIEILDSIKTPARLQNKPVRITVNELYKSTSGHLMGDCAVSKIEAGMITEKDKLILMPHNEKVSIKGIECNGDTKMTGKVGDSCTLALNLPSKFDSTFIKSGDVLCDPTYPIKFVDEFRCQLKIFGIKRPLIKGHKVTIHSHFAKCDGKLSSLEKIVDSTTGDILKKKPKLVKAGDNVIVRIKMNSFACLELFSNFKTFGRVVLRDSSESIAAGIIIELLMPRNNDGREIMQ